jgi:hypothetical protein
VKTKAHQVYRQKSGRIVPGVTTVLGILNKPALLYWAWNLGMQQIDYRKFKDDKAEIGTLAHNMVEDHLNGAKTDFADHSKNQIDAAENSFLSWLEWEKQHPIKKIHSIEEQLISEELPFGGTNDIFCRLESAEGEFDEIIDLKTGKGIYDEYVYQVAALKHLQEENGKVVGRCRIINIPRTEDETFLERVIGPDELGKGWEIFKACLQIYTLTHKEKKERVEPKPKEKKK